MSRPRTTPALLTAAALVTALVACVDDDTDPTSSSNENGSSTGNGGSPASGGGGSGGGGGEAFDPALVKTWATDVTIGSRFGTNVTQVVRWAKSPTLSVIEGSAQDRADLDELIPQLNALMAPIEITVIADGDTTADIDVYFINLDEFDAVGEANGFPVVPGNWGYFYRFWNGSLELTEGYILLAKDMLSGDSLRHFTFEETTQLCGFANDSPIFSDSVFYADGPDGGAATELGDLDKRLVRLVYQHTEPGDDATAFGAAFDAHFFD